MHGDTEIAVEPRAPRVDALRNHETVIDAALEVLSRNPNASMQTIAERSGVGRSTVYRHFPTRIDLVHAIFERVVEEARDVTSKVIEFDQPATAVLEKLGPAVVSIGLRFRYLQGMQQLGDEVITESTFDPDDPVRLYVVAAMERGEIRAGLHLQWILTTISALSTSTMLEVHAKRMDAEEAGEVLGATFVRAFAA